MQYTVQTCIQLFLGATFFWHWIESQCTPWLSFTYPQSSIIAISATSGTLPTDASCYFPSTVLTTQTAYCSNLQFGPSCSFGTELSSQCNVGGVPSLIARTQVTLLPLASLSVQSPIFTATPISVSGCQVSLVTNPAIAPSLSTQFSQLYAATPRLVVPPSAGNTYRFNTVNRDSRTIFVVYEIQIPAGKDTMILDFNGVNVVNVIVYIDVSLQNTISELDEINTGGITNLMYWYSNSVTILAQQSVATYLPTGTITYNLPSNQNVDGQQVVNKIQNIGPGILTVRPLSVFNFCIQCMPGTFINGASCLPCPANTFQPEPNSSSCRPCPTGSVSIAGSSSCTLCLPGTIAIPATSQCQNCSAGTYSGTGFTQCIFCINNKTSLAAAGSCTIDCAANQHSNAYTGGLCASNSCKSWVDYEYSIASLVALSQDDGVLISDASCYIQSEIITTSTVYCPNWLHGNGTYAQNLQCVDGTPPSLIVPIRAASISPFSVTSLVAPRYTITPITVNPNRCTLTAPLNPQPPKFNPDFLTLMETSPRFAPNGVLTSPNSYTFTLTNFGKTRFIIYRINVPAGATTITLNFAGVTVGAVIVELDASLNGNLVNNIVFQSVGVQLMITSLYDVTFKFGHNHSMYMPTTTLTYNTTGSPGINAFGQHYVNKLNVVGTPVFTLQTSGFFRFCIQCLPGYFLNASVCTQCPANQFQSEPNSASCQACPAQQYSLAGSVQCTLCGDGTFFSSSTGRCEVCSAGTFSVGSVTSCTPCANNFYSIPGSSSCPFCAPGYRLSAGSCLPCPVNTYNNNTEIGVSVCPACPTNTSTKGATGMINCIDNCGPGFYLSGSSCLQCPLGFYRDDITVFECTPCPIGTFNSNSGATECFDCGSGFASKAGSFACQRCLPGTFSTGPRSGKCTYCEPGFFQADNGATSCDPCGTGLASAFGSTICFPCPPGQEVVNGKCENCQPGSYKATSGIGSCNLCPPDTYAEEAGMPFCLPCIGASTGEISCSVPLRYRDRPPEL